MGVPGCVTDGCLFGWDFVGLVVYFVLRGCSGFVGFLCYFWCMVLLFWVLALRILMWFAYVLFLCIFMVGFLFCGVLRWVPCDLFAYVLGGYLILRVSGLVHD